MYKISDLSYLYDKLKKRALHSFENNKIEMSLKYSSLSAIVGYHFNLFYNDDELDTLLINISSSIFSGKNLGTIKKDRVVLIDSFSSSKVLNVQYLRALISLEVDFLYIVMNESESMKSFYLEVENSKLGKLYSVNTRSYSDRAMEVCEILDEYNPSHILSHIEPWDTSALVAIASRTNAIKYNINLTDHAFWLGAKIFEYVLEFREYGATLSFQRRGFKKTQILFNPFYPVVLDNKFLGFPEIIKDEIIIFSGGSYNKIIDESNKFLCLVKKILDENSNTVFLFAGMGYGDVRIKEFIKNNNLENRFILLGERKDIDQVFLHSDIYFGTYPINGGLMTLYAAYYSKPTISYIKDPKVNDVQEDLVFVNNSKKIKCSFEDERVLLDEMKRLVNDSEYRIRQGAILKENLTTEQDFVEMLKKNLFYPCSQFSNCIEIDYDTILDKFITIYNLGSKVHVNVMLIKIIGLRLFMLRLKFVSSIFITALIFIPRKIKAVIAR